MKTFSLVTAALFACIATAAHAGTISPTGTTISGPGLGAASVPVIFTLSQETITKRAVVLRTTM